MLQMQGKIALVTGASSGLGAHFAELLARVGARVAVGARRMDRLESLVDRIGAAGGESLAVALDVTDSRSVAAALDAAEQRFGPLTTLVNNAGVAFPRSFLKLDESGWDTVMETNLKGVWRVAREVAGRMAASGTRGSIVNMGSILGLRPGFGETAYATSKAAVVHMTRVMALELARKGIRVNALCPGYFVTEMNAQYLESDEGQRFLDTTPAGRAGVLSELDGPLLLLASDAGSFINGVALPVDGGHLVSSL